jgi:hypothetical protein
MGYMGLRRWCSFCFYRWPIFDLVPVIAPAYNTSREHVTILNFKSVGYVFLEQPAGYVGEHF